MTYTYFWPPESQPPDYEPQNYDRGLGVDRDPSWQTRGLPDRPTVWPVGIYWCGPDQSLKATGKNGAVSYPLRRCYKTGNIVGTDTWDCLCHNCSEYRKTISMANQEFYDKFFGDK